MQTLHSIQMYNNHKSFDEIVKECDQVWRVALACSNKCPPRTQVNFVEDISEEEEERNRQAAVNLVDDDAARLQRD